MSSVNIQMSFEVFMRSQKKSGQASKNCSKILGNLSSEDVISKIHFMKTIYGKCLSDNF